MKINNNIAVKMSDIFGNEFNTLFDKQQNTAVKIVITCIRQWW